MTANVSHRRGPSPACDALFHPALACHLHGEGAACRKKAQPTSHTSYVLQVDPGVARRVAQPWGRCVGASLTRHVLVSELDVDDIVSRLRGAVGDPACAILQVLCVDVHLAGTLDGQAEPTIACGRDTPEPGGQVQWAHPSFQTTTTYLHRGCR